MRQILCVGLLWMLIRTSSCLGDEPPKIIQDESGILRGDFQRVTKPVSATDYQLGTVRGFHVTPDAARAVLHVWAEGEGRKMIDRLIVVSVTTGKTECVLDEHAGGWIDKRPLCVTADSKAVITGNPSGEGLAKIELLTGKVTQTFIPKRGILRVQFADDGSKAIGVGEDSVAVAFDFVSGQLIESKLTFLPEKAQWIAYPLPNGQMLVHYAPNREKNAFVLFDPGKAKVQTLTQFDGNGVILPAPDGSRAYVFREEDPNQVVWTSIETWDLKTAKQVKRQALKPPLASVDLKLSSDGRILFLHEYMVQPLIVWNLEQGRFIAAVAPADGGCVRAAITPDGKKVVAIVGPWKMGTLIPKQLAVYDTSALLK